MSIWNYLPQTPGLLPKWQLVVASVALLNTIQNFFSLKFSRVIYVGTPALVNPLQARTFAIWTLTASIVRFYCAYHIHEKSVYDITMFTYLIAFGHFFSEFVIFKSTKLNGPFISPVIVSTTSLIWMFSQYDSYVKS